MPRGQRTKKAPIAESCDTDEEMEPSESGGVFDAEDADDGVEDTEDDQDTIAPQVRAKIGAAGAVGKKGRRPAHARSDHGDESSSEVDAPEVADQPKEEPTHDAESDDEEGTDGDGAEDDDVEDTETVESVDESASRSELIHDDDGVEDAGDDSHDAEQIQTSVEERLPFMETDVVRNATENMIVIPDDDRRTSQIMSVPEYTEAISIRTEQISADGSQGAMIDEIPALATNARDIAIAEMKARRCPLKIVRHVGSLVDPDGHVKNYIEIWSPNNMTHPPFL